MSNLSKQPAVKVIPYCQDPKSSCGLFAYGGNTGVKRSEFYAPMFFSGVGADGFNGKTGIRNGSVSRARRCSTLKPDGTVVVYECPDKSSAREKVCYEGTGVGHHQVPCKGDGKEKFSGFNWSDVKNVFKGEEVNLADDKIGQMPDEVGGSGGKVSADQIMSGIESATELAKILGSKRELSEVEGVCGKQKSGILVGKSVKQAWANCASNYMQAKLNADKGRGLSTGTWIGITLGSATLVGVIIFFATRKKVQPQAIMTKFSALK
jgi:hypothetical protein